MPRLPNSLLRRARSIDPLLLPLLRTCRDLRSAQNELRWLREHAVNLFQNTTSARQERGWQTALRKLVEQRSLGKPLQYLLGTEYFGELEIVCKPGVLIPRADTASAVCHLASRLRESRRLPEELRVLDLCTGTGCIPLLFQHEINSNSANRVKMQQLGVDISPTAINLARLNRQRLVTKVQSQSVDRTTADTRHHSSVQQAYLFALHRTKFILADILSSNPQNNPPPLLSKLCRLGLPNQWDILISNPPYISPQAFARTTDRSVRNFEPKVALVPPTAAFSGLSSTPNGSQIELHPGDTFYQPLLTIAEAVWSSIVLLEVGDMEQAGRVARMAEKRGIWDGIEIWRDEPGAQDNNEKLFGFPVKGRGNGRAVLCYIGEGRKWLGFEP